MTRAPGIARARRQRTLAPRAAQRGVALIVAILLVALGTIIAATVAYENAMTARRGTGTYVSDESLLIAQGAEALAAPAIANARRAVAQGSRRRGKIPNMAAMARSACVIP